MIFVKRIGMVLGSAGIALLCSGQTGAQEPGPGDLPTTRERPSVFGTQDYNVTTISAMAFDPFFNSIYSTSGSLGRFGPSNTLSDYATNLNLPAGAVIDFIGLNSTTDTAAVLHAEVIRRTFFGTTSVILSVDSTVHSWYTDLNANPRGYLWYAAAGEALILHVQSLPNPNSQFFGWVEVWWKRSVSPAPATATFGDVPVGHPQHQFVEALAAAGITAGCGGGNYCPNAPVTRGQMAVFLASALGLHWAP